MTKDILEVGKLYYIDYEDDIYPENSYVGPARLTEFSTPGYSPETIEFKLEDAKSKNEPHAFGYFVAEDVKYEIPEYNPALIIKETLREYLKYPSTDGSTIRQGLRNKLAELIKL